LNGIAAASRVRVRDVTIHGNGVGIWKIYGNVSHAARVDLDNVIIRDNTNEGIKGGGAIRAKDTTIRASFAGRRSTLPCSSSAC
jgi:predicted outer membrane repeat protein